MIRYLVTTDLKIKPLGLGNDRPKEFKAIFKNYNNARDFVNKCKGEFECTSAGEKIQKEKDLSL
jgi:hypothetical protein